MHSTKLPLYELMRQFSETAHMPAFLFQLSFRALSHHLCMHGRQLGCPPGGVVAFLPTSPPIVASSQRSILTGQLLNYHVESPRCAAFFPPAWAAAFDSHPSAPHVLTSLVTRSIQPIAGRFSARQCRANGRARGLPASFQLAAALAPVPLLSGRASARARPGAGGAVQPCYMCVCGCILSEE